MYDATFAGYLSISLTIFIDQSMRLDTVSVISPVFLASAAVNGVDTVSVSEAASTTVTLSLLDSVEPTEVVRIPVPVA
jgi:hypothetical protein